MSISFQYRFSVKNAIFLKLRMNSSPTNVANMRQRINSALILIMACDSASSHYLNRVIFNWKARNTRQWNLNRNTNCSIKKMHLKTSCAKYQPFCPGGDESNNTWADYFHKVIHACSYDYKPPWLKYYTAHFCSWAKICNIQAIDICDHGCFSRGIMWNACDRIAPEW